MTSKVVIRPKIGQNSTPFFKRLDHEHHPWQHQGHGQGFLDQMGPSKIPLRPCWPLKTLGPELGVLARGWVLTCPHPGTPPRVQKWHAYFRTSLYKGPQKKSDPQSHHEPHLQQGQNHGYGDQGQKVGEPPEGVVHGQEEFFS